MSLIVELGLKLGLGLTVKIRAVVRTGNLGLRLEF